MATKDKIKKIILICFYAVFSLVMLFTVSVDFLRPLHFLVPWKMMIATAGFGLIFFGLLKLWSKVPEKITDSKILLTAVLVFEVALIWAMALIHGKGHLGVGDYFCVYNSAAELAEGRDVTYYNYFMVYGNNTMPMLMLSVLIKFSRFLHIDEFYFLLTFATALVVLSIWAIFVLTEEKYKKIRIPAVLFAMICLPVYVFSSTFYTDTLSFGVGLISLALLKISLKNRKYFLIPFAAVFAAWGVFFKITAIIPLIAAFVAIILTEIPKENKKKNIISIGVYLLLIVLLCAGVKGIASGNSLYRESKERSNPLLAWIAMGMSGNGSYADNVAFSDEMNSLSTKEEKNELAIRYMKEHIKEAFSFSHNVNKTQRNFASGMFTCFDYTSPDENGSFLYKVLDPGGELFGRSCQFTFCYISIVYLWFLFGSVRALVLLIKEKEKKTSEIISYSKVLADISMFGIFLFLMLWESNNRQLYNQLPLFILALFVNAWDTLNIFRIPTKKKHSQ